MEQNITILNKDQPIKSIFDQYHNVINIHMEETNQTIQVENYITGKDLFQNDDDVIALTSSQELMSLQEPIDISTNVVPIRKTSKIAIQLLQDTIAYLVQVAAYKLFPGQTLLHKFDSEGLMYFALNDMFLNDQDVDNLTKEVNIMIEKEIDINRQELSYQNAIQIFQEQDYQFSVNLIKTLNTPCVSIACVNDHHYKLKQLWKTPLLSNTKVIKNLFKIFKFKDSIAVKVFSFDESNNLTVEQIKSSVQSDLYDIQQLYLENCQSLQISCLADLNKIATNPKLLKQKLNCFEFNHEKQIAEISNRINRNIKCIFVAGPSSSNKTTFANRLCCSLHARGIETLRISLDDYYLEKDQIQTRNEKGEIDYEALEALDLVRIDKDLNSVISGKETQMRVYDFVTQKEIPGRIVKLPENGVIIVEGIHALNDKIANCIDQSKRIRVFIQPVGQLSWDESRVISSENIRLMRRIARDFIFRGRSAEMTMKSWSDVRAGEFKYILPNQCKADAYFNSSIIYETFVLKIYLSALLQQVSSESPYYGQARYLLRLLAPLSPISEQYVPESSLLREFMPGGSDYEDFYY